MNERDDFEKWAETVESLLVGISSKQQLLYMGWQAATARLAAIASGWRCFHCAEVFTTPGAARDHFGSTIYAEPGCQIKAGDERNLLRQLRVHENAANELRHQIEVEGSEIHRAMYAMISRHQKELREQEESGYAKGLKDYAEMEDRSAAKIAESKVALSEGTDLWSTQRQKYEWDIYAITERAEKAEARVVDLERFNESQRALLKRYEEHKTGSFWCWQKDGDNFVESLACQVLMEAETVREFVKAEADAARLREAIQDALRVVQCARYSSAETILRTALGEG